MTTAEQITYLVDAQADQWVRELRKTQANLQAQYFAIRDEFGHFVEKPTMNSEADSPRRVIYPLMAEETIVPLSSASTLGIYSGELISITNQDEVTLVSPGSTITVGPLPDGQPVFQSRYTVPNFYAMDSKRVVSTGSFEVSRIQGDVEIGKKPFMVDAVTTTVNIQVPAQNADLLISHTLSSALPGTLLPGFTDAIFFNPEEETGRAKLESEMREKEIALRKFQNSPFSHMFDTSMADVYHLGPAQINTLLSNAASFVEPFNNIVQYGYSVLSVHNKWVKTTVASNPLNGRLVVAFNTPTQHHNGWNDERSLMSILVSGIPDNLAYPNPVTPRKSQDTQPKTPQMSMREMVLAGFKNAQITSQ